MGFEDHFPPQRIFACAPSPRSRSRLDKVRSAEIGTPELFLGTDLVHYCGHFRAPLQPKPPNFRSKCLAEVKLMAGTSTAFY